MKNTRKYFIRFSSALLFTLFLIIAVTWIILWSLNDYDANFLNIDSCLDNGGSWDSSLKECKFE